MKIRSLILLLIPSVLFTFTSVNAQGIKDIIKQAAKEAIQNPAQKAQKPAPTPVKTTPQQRQQKVSPAFKARESVAELKRLAAVTDFQNVQGLSKFPDELEAEVFNFVVEGGTWQQLGTTEVEVATLAQKFWDGFIGGQYKTLQANAQSNFCGDGNVDDIYEYVRRSGNPLEHYGISRDAMFGLLQKSCKGVSVKDLKKKAYGFDANKLALNNK